MEDLRDNADMLSRASFATSAPLARIGALALAACMIATLFTATEQIGHQTWFPPPYLDKVAHMGYYGIMAFLLDRGFDLRRAWPAILLASLVGAADEWHQLYFANRGSDVLDWVADTVAAVAVVIASRYLLRLWLMRARRGMAAPVSPPVR